MIDIELLRKLAEKATPGPWNATCKDCGGPKDGDLLGLSNWPDDEWLGCELEGPLEPPGRGQFVGKDAAYMAAFNPSVALELLERLRKAESYIAELMVYAVPIEIEE